MALVHSSGFLTGAIPTPRHKLQAATPFRVRAAIPAQMAMVPKQLSMWGNQTYGMCVTTEEAFAIAAYSVLMGLPERFVTEATAIAWARKRNLLNGAELTPVMDMMAKSGMVDSANNTDKDGPYNSVDYSSESTLQSAISQGPVKIGIDANALPSSAGNVQGWNSLGGTRSYGNEDHCVSLSGYGPAEWLYQQLGVSMPPTLAGHRGYLLFTWSTIGFVDHPWVMSTCGEAWVRNPTTLGLPTPTPIPPPVPVPTTPYTIAFASDMPAGAIAAGQAVLSSPMPAGNYWLSPMDPLPPVG